jgi:hypothetical protein
MDQLTREPSIVLLAQSLRRATLHRSQFQGPLRSHNSSLYILPDSSGWAPNCRVNGIKYITNFHLKIMKTPGFATLKRLTSVDTAALNDYYFPLVGWSTQAVVVPDRDEIQLHIRLNHRAFGFKTPSPISIRIVAGVLEHAPKCVTRKVNHL